MSTDAVTALNRFGLGARPGDLARVAPDPRGALRAELKADRALISAEAAEAAGLAGNAADMRAAFAAEAERRARRDSLKGVALPALLPPAMTGGAPPFRPEPQAEALIFRAEAAARFAAARDAEIGFLERLVLFWSNHLCVSAGKAPLLRAGAGAFEREAIRPHVLGRFADMLVAAERHPAMLLYLDNARSAGPASRAVAKAGARASAGAGAGEARPGAKGGRGLNENLAREILELHTLGVDGGYAQADVAALARAITGWTFAGREGRLGEPGAFAFDAAAHEPGDETVVGRLYPAGGFGQGEAALNDLARHPATARHVATKLVRHFVADDPPPAAVERIAGVFTKRDGDLRAVALALVDLPEAWPAASDGLPGKVRSPLDMLTAAARLTGARPADPGPTLGALRTLGQPLWEPPGPNGFPDTAATWASPENMKLRLDLCAQAAHADRGTADPVALLEAAVGDALSPDTRDAVGRAESRAQGLALVLMSPEFQRR